MPDEIDTTNADSVYDQLVAAMDAGTTVVVADLTATTFCDSSGLQRLVMMDRQATSRGGQLRLAVTPRGLVRRLLELTGMDQRLLVYPSVPAALVGLGVSVPRPSEPVDGPPG
jgi:anti-anti-sigma factor